jgi:hypothetical protein
MNTLNRIISSIVLLALFSFDGVAAYGQNSATDSAMIKRNEQMRESHIYLLVSGSRILWTQKGEVKDFSKSKLYINGNPADFNAFKTLKDNRVSDCYVNEDNGGKSIIVNTMGHGAKVYLDGKLLEKDIDYLVFNNDTKLHEFGVDVNGQQIACFFTKGFEGDAKKVFADLIGPGGREGLGGESAYILYTDNPNGEYDLIVNGKPISKSDFAKMKVKKMKSLMIKWPPVDLSKMMIR